MNNEALARLLDNDVDEIGRFAIDLAADERWPTLELAAEMIDGGQTTLRAVKTLRFIQAALSEVRNGRLPFDHARIISNAALRAAEGTDAAEVYRAAVDVMSLLALKADAQGSDLDVLARLLERMRELLEKQDTYENAKSA